jgi:hypothetical protein
MEVGTLLVRKLAADLVSPCRQLFIVIIPHEHGADH